MYSKLGPAVVSTRWQRTSGGHWWSQRSICIGSFSAVSGSLGVSFSAGGLEVAGARWGENWSVHASGEKRRSGQWLSLGGLVVVSAVSAGFRFFSRAFHVGGFGGPLVVSAEHRRSLGGIGTLGGISMLVSAVSVVSGLFQCCWSRAQCWEWCDENLSAYASEETRCSGCRASRRSEQAPCVKSTIHQQPVNEQHSTRTRVSVPAMRIRTHSTRVSRCH